MVPYVHKASTSNMVRNAGLIVGGGGIVFQFKGLVWTQHHEGLVFG